MMYSSDEIWRGENQERSITQDLDQIETDIDNLETGKAPTNHTHTEYALGTHTHTEYAPTIHEHSQYAQANHTHTEYAAADHEHTGYAPTNHSHAEYALGTHTHTEYALTDHTHAEYALVNHEHDQYALTTHSHTGYAASSHSHAQGDVTGLIQALAAKAEATHDHTLGEVVGLIAALAAKADLVDGKVPSSQLPSFVDDVLEYATVSKFPTTGESGKIYVATSTNKTYRWSGSAYVEVAGGIALGETASTAYRGDRGKTAYDHSQNGTVHVTAAQKTAWDGKADGDHTHTPASIGAAPASHTHDYAAPDHTHTPASIGAAPASHTHNYAAANHTHTADSVGAAPASHTHTPASIGAAPASHTHDYAATNHTHTPASIGAAPTNHTHNYAASNHTHTPASIGAAAENHTHTPQIITAHMSNNSYTVTTGDDYINVPLNSSVTIGDALTRVGSKIRIGAGVSKVLISAQICIASGNCDVNRYLAVRKNTTTQLARSQRKICYPTLPQSMSIVNLLVNVTEGDLLSLDYYGKANDLIYGDNLLTYMTVQKMA